MASIPTTTLGTDLEITRVVTGLWQVSGGHGEIDPERAVDHMETLHERGFTSFDMADHYGPAEELTGKLIGRLGDGAAADGSDAAAETRVQAFTKWVPEPGDMTPELTRAAVDRARRRLASTRIDLLQFHWWDYLDPRYIDAMEQLARLREEGLIGNLGLTNFNTAHMRILLSLGVPVVSNQVHYSLLDGRPAGDMTRACREHGVKLLCYGTLAGGFFSERWLGVTEPRDEDVAGNWSLMKYLRFIRVAGGWEVFQNLLTALAAVAEKHQVSLANVAVRWVLEQPMVGAVLVGTRLGISDHSDDNERLFTFDLDEEDKNRIEEARVRLSPIPGDCGDEYRKPPYLTAAGDLSHHKTRSRRAALCERNPDPPVDRMSYGSGTHWESMASYSRALRRGNTITVSGTTASYGSRRIGGEDAAAQAEFCLDKVEAAVEALGGRLSDVIRTRVYVPDIPRDWEAVARAHGRRFADIAPANTLVGAPLVGEGYRVEIEADALIQ